MSDLFPEVAKCVDDMCIIKSMHGSNSRHGGALLELHTGSDTFIRPSMGSWITYGLGSENSSMPGFVTICPTQSHGGANNFGSAFLPAPYAGNGYRFSGNSCARCKDSVYSEYRNSAFDSAYGDRLHAGVKPQATRTHRS